MRCCVVDGEQRGGSGETRRGRRVRNQMRCNKEEGKHIKARAGDSEEENEGARRTKGGGV